MVPVIRLSTYDSPGAAVGVIYRVLRAGRLVGSGTPQLQLRRDGTILLRPGFWPVGGGRYALRVHAEDIHGNVVVARLVLVPLGNGGPPPWGPGGTCPAVDALLRACP